jgi:two-component system NarL family sensor kinase
VVQEKNTKMITRSESTSNIEKLQQRNWELSILNEIADSLNKEVDLARALQITLAQVVDLFNLQTGWIWLLHEEVGEPYLAASQNLPPALVENPSKMEGWCYCLTSYVDGNLEGAANVNVITCSRLKGLVDGTNGLRYHSSVPLSAPQGKMLGILNVTSGDWRELSEDDLRLLYTIGDMLSIAIERARLFDQSVEYGAAEERNRLAREIHDTLAQGLAAITLQLETAERLMEEDAKREEARQRVHQSLVLAQDNLEAARRSVIELRSTPLEGQTLAQALSDLVEQQNEISESEINISISGGTHPLPAQVEVGLFRIAQEALNNALRHAKAEHIEISLTISAGETRLEIKDDGRGFDPEDVDVDRFGLTGMNERAKLMGGIFKVQTTLGTGTLLEVILPAEQGSKRRDE